MPKQISNKRRRFEIIAAVLTGISKIVFVDVLDRKLYFIVSAILFWLIYVLIRQNQDKDLLKYWGFDWNTAPALFKKLLPAAIILVAIFYLIGYFRGVAILSWHILPILLLYPIWGVIQQFLVVGLVAGNLQDMAGRPFPEIFIVILTALLFGIVHYPSWFLIVGTFLLAIVYTIIYLRKRQLWVLGFYHGLLGCFFYFFTLGRDPWEEVFGILSNS